MNQPKISIIIATFNAGRTLSSSLESVLAQSFTDWECIVVDGASKDNTISIVEEYEKKDTRFRHISEPDKGIYDAFNKGLKMANGDWVMYLGSDDRYMPDALKALTENAGDSDAVYGDTILYDEDRKTETLQSCLPVNDNMFCCHQSIMMKRNVVEQLGGFDMKYKLLADKDLMVKAYKKGFTFSFIHQPIAIFNLGGVSTTKLDSCYESLDINKKYRPLYKAYLHFIISVANKLYKRYIRK